MKLYPDLAVQYMNEAARIRTARSRISYRKIMSLLQRQHPGQQAKDFTPEMLAAFCIGRFDGKPGHAAPATQRNRRAHVRSTFEWAHWRKLIPTNPAAELHLAVRPGSGTTRSHTWLDKEQVLKVSLLLDTDDIHQQRDRMIFLTGVLTGLRCFELAELTWPKFSADLSELTLKGKGDKFATLGVPEELQAELARWRTFRMIGGVAVFPSFRQVMHPVKQKRVQIVDWDRPLGESGIENAVEAIGDMISVKLNPHDLRRTFAGLLEAAGVPLKDIQLAMRHENIGTTDNYLAKNPARTVAVVKGFRLGL